MYIKEGELMETLDKRLSLIEHDFSSYVQQTAAKLNKLEALLEEQEKKMKSMELYKEITEYQYTQIMESLKTLNEKTIPDLTAQIQELKNKPVKRYEQVITGILGALAGSLGTFIASIFINKN